MSIDLDSFFNKNTNDESKAIIIGNVSPKVTIEDLYAIFENFGDITDIKPLKTITQPVMCCYYIVIFDTKDAAETTIYINNTEILGMKIDIILVSNNEKKEELLKTIGEEKDIRTQSTASTDPHTMAKLRKTVCVRNLGPSSSNEKVQKHFSLCGNIRYMEFNTNDSVARQVVIEFETEDAALRALAQDSSTFGDRPIRVSPSTHAIKGNQKEKKPFVSKKEVEMVEDLLASLDKKVKMKEEEKKEKELDEFLEKGIMDSKKNDKNMEEYENDRYERKKDSSGYRRYSSRDRGYNNRSYRSRSRSRSYSRERNYGRKYDKYERGYRMNERRHERGYRGRSRERSYRRYD
ncbi:RRM domain-containing protein [Entamoeba marina]